MQYPLPLLSDIWMIFFLKSFKICWLQIKFTTKLSLPHVLAYTKTLIMRFGYKLTLYAKRDDSSFPVVNFRFPCSNILAALAYWLYISQFIRYFRAWISHHNFLDRRMFQLSHLLSRPLFLEWRIYTEFVLAWTSKRVQHVKQDLLTLSKYLRSPLLYIWHLFYNIFN